MEVFGYTLTRFQVVGVPVLLFIGLLLSGLLKLYVRTLPATPPNIPENPRLHRLKRTLYKATLAVIAVALALIATSPPNFLGL